MGCYDVVVVACPACGRSVALQSKGGPCLLETYELADCPADVLSDANRHAPHRCACGADLVVVFSRNARWVAIVRP